jgi:hypothetical protein
MQLLLCPFYLNLSLLGPKTRAGPSEEPADGGIVKKINKGGDDCDMSQAIFNLTASGSGRPVVKSATWLTVCDMLDVLLYGAVIKVTSSTWVTAVFFSSTLLQ